MFYCMFYFTCDRSFSRLENWPTVSDVFFNSDGRLTVQLSPTHTADTDATQLSSGVASASASAV